MKPKNEGKCRQEYLKFIKENRDHNLHSNAVRYEGLPANIRAAIAKVAGVTNKRLDEMTSMELHKMNMETKKLITKLLKASYILALVDVLANLD